MIFAQSRPTRRTISTRSFALTSAIDTFVYWPIREVPLSARLIKLIQRARLAQGTLLQVFKSSPGLSFSLSPDSAPATLLCLCACEIVERSPPFKSQSNHWCVRCKHSKLSIGLAARNSTNPKLKGLNGSGNWRSEDTNENHLAAR